MQDAQVGEVGEGVAQRRELPVEDGDDTGLRRVEDEVVDPEVAVDDGDAVGHDAAGGDQLPQVADDLGEPFDRPRILRLWLLLLSCQQGAAVRNLC